MDRESVNTELHTRFNFGQRRLSALAAGEAIGNDADFMAQLGLAVGEIQNVPNDSSDRRADRVDNSKWAVSREHHQNQRSPTRTVSPGRIGVPSGTTVLNDPAGSVWVMVTRSRCALGEKPPAIATALSTLMLGT